MLQKMCDEDPFKYNGMSTSPDQRRTITLQELLSEKNGSRFL